jgi:MSHA biogenesis protein MshO
MKGPIDAYFAAGRRAALTDVADTTVRRMARDIRRALPNSIRLTGSSCLEFIPTKTGGRYRSQDIATGDDSSLDFSKSDTKFNMFGDNATFSGLPLAAEQVIAVNDLIVVYNLGITGANAYAGDNYSVISAIGAAAAETLLTLPVAGKQFPLASPNNRFQVVSSTEQLVSYVCNGTNLFRTVSTLPAAAAACPSTGAGASLIASNVNCGSTSFSYSGSDLMRNALVSMKLTIQDSSGTESVTLQHEVHVDNTP